MIALPAARELAAHEAHHAAALLIFGWPPLVARIDWPTQEMAGSVRPDWGSRDPDERSMRDLLIATMMGPLSDGALRMEDYPPDPDDWPEGAQRDIEQAAFIAQWLGLDRVDWVPAGYDAVALSRERRFKRLVVAIAERLERVELLLQPELIALAEEVDAT